MEEIRAPVYMDSYTLQSDYRIRVPKSVITNLNAVPGKTVFSFYYDCDSRSVILKLEGQDNSEKKNKEEVQ